MQWDDIVLAGLVVLLAGAGVYAYISNDGFIVAREVMEEMDEMKAEMADARVQLKNYGRGADPQGITNWINSDPLFGEDLRGKVVLVDFWTYSCINCIRTFPYVQGWHEKYADKGLVLLGVHTPEFDFEKKAENVEMAVRDYGLTYPVAQDNDYATWNAFANRYWPAHYLMDVDGNLRYFHFGEGKYGETEAAIQQLLVEGGLAQEGEFSAATEEEDISRREVGTPEIYLGAKRLQYLGNPPAPFVAGQPRPFAMPSSVVDNLFYLVGEWKVEPEFAELTSGEGKIVMRYRAREANMVLASSDGEPVTVTVLIDGQETKTFEVAESRLYTLADLEESGWHTLELRVSRPGLQAYSFTFG